MSGSTGQGDTPERPQRFYASADDNLGHAYGELADVHIEETGSSINFSVWFESEEGFLISIPKVGGDDR